jgi:hypothetical protein
MSDAQIAWWLGHFHVSAATARHARHALTRAGRVRFARRLIPGAAPGCWCMLWEVTPRTTR